MGIDWIDPVHPMLKWQETCIKLQDTGFHFFSIFIFTCLFCACIISLFDMWICEYLILFIGVGNWWTVSNKDKIFFYYLIVIPHLLPTIQDLNLILNLSHFLMATGSDAILLRIETLRGLYPVETISIVGKNYGLSLVMNPSTEIRLSILVTSMLFLCKNA